MCLIQPNQQVRIIPVLIAVPADDNPTDVHEGIASVLAELYDGEAFGRDVSPVLDWGFAAGRSILVTASKGPLEGDVFKGVRVINPLTPLP